MLTEDSLLETPKQERQVILNSAELGCSGSECDKTMKKAEALAVLHEISMLCPELTTSNNAERIDPDRAKISMRPSGSYELRIRCSLNNELREAIQPVVEKHNLEIIEIENSITIFRLHEK